MMRLMSPVRLLASTSQRWGQFHRGTELVAERSGEGAAWLRLTTPPHVYDEIALIGLTEGLRAVIDCSGISSEFTLVEFDEGNLFALDRFPGSDAVERGPRANVGISWTRFDPQGWSMGVTVGRVFREANLGQFGPGSGLAGAQSDWLAAANFTLADGLALTARLVMDDDFSLTKGEARVTEARAAVERARAFATSGDGPRSAT